MNNKRNHLVRRSTRGSPAPWLQRGVSRPWLMMRNVTLTFSIISSYPTQILLLWKERSLNLPLNQIFFFKDSFLSASILTFQMVGEVRYVKTCQVRSGRLSRWLGCRKALEKLPLFGETNVCTVQNQPALCATVFSFCDFSCFLTTVFTVQNHCVHCSKC